MRSLNLRSAISAIEEHGALLLYPIDNKPDPKSVWSVFYPRTKMKWEWDQDGDDRVVKLWQLKTELAVSKKVIYSKWYRGRATFFSLEAFKLLIASQEKSFNLTNEAKQILEVLEMDSPLSTKQIKVLTDLRGKVFESTYQKAMNQLFMHFLTVGMGEVEDGAFPSLAVSATKTIFEDLWLEANQLDPLKAKIQLEKKLGQNSLFLKQFRKLNFLNSNLS